MKKLLAIVVLGLLWSGNAYADKNLMKHFKKKHSIIFGDTVKIAVSDSNGIVFYYMSKFISKEELRAAGKEHCANNSKKLDSEEHTNYGSGQYTVMFFCK